MINHKTLVGYYATNGEIGRFYPITNNGTISLTPSTTPLTTYRRRGARRSIRCFARTGKK